MKPVYVALICLGVVGGLIHCTPIDLFPKELLKDPSKLPGVITSKFGEITEKLKPGKEGGGEGLDKVNPSKILELIKGKEEKETKEEEDPTKEEETKPEDSKPDGDEAKERKRRAVISPGTKVINNEPFVEARFEVDSLDMPSRKGHFLKDNGGFINSDSEGLQGGNRPVVIYIGKCGGVHLKNEKCEECDD